MPAIGRHDLESRSRYPVLMSELKSTVPALPAYLRDTYSWAYLNERSVHWLDRPWIVDSILWGNAARLMDAAVNEIPVGAHVLQAAAVYGDFSARLARRIGLQGRLTVIDVAPIQVARTNAKLAEHPNTQAFVGDLAQPVAKAFDAVCCFFLLHEVPPAVRGSIVANLLEAVKPGGKVVFVDYNRPRRGHPLGPLMRLVWRRLEPFAESLLDVRIAAIASAGAGFSWHEQSFFGGLYQKVVGTRTQLSPATLLSATPCVRSPRSADAVDALGGTVSRCLTRVRHEPVLP